MMETVILFTCVSAAVVFTNGVILFYVARYVLKSLEKISEDEAERIAKLQSQGSQAINQLIGKLKSTNTSRFTGFDGSGDGQGGSA